MLFELLFSIILILTSGFLSSSEVALFSLSRFQVRALKDHIHPSTYKKIKRLLQDPPGLLLSILVVNEVVNIALSSLITQSIAQQPGGSHSSGSNGGWLSDLFQGTAISTFLVLIACEITPKMVAARANRLIALSATTPLAILYDFMMPARFVLGHIANGVLAVFQTRKTPSRARNDSSADAHARGTQEILKESEFLLMVEEGHKEGAIQRSELDLIQNVFELDDTRVSDIYTPLSQVQLMTIDTSIKQALTGLKGNRYSRIPIVAPNRHQILGILYTKDLLRSKLDQTMTDRPVSELMRRPLVVNPTMHLNALFRKFKRQRTHMAVVQKVSGETLGIVTMNDVLDSLFGDLIPDELEED